MAITASRFRDLAAAGSCLNRLVEAAEREVVRVPEAITGLGRVLTEHIVWSMAIVADGYLAVAAYLLERNGVSAGEVPLTLDATWAIPLESD